MKLKKIVLIITALLVCLAGATAATESPIAGTGEIIDAPDGYTNLVIGSVTSEIEGTFAQYAAGNNIGGTLIAIKGIQITNENGDVLTGEATISINVPGLKSGDKVTLVHLKDDGTFEIIEGVVVEDGKVTFTSTFSYFGFYVQSSTATSPKTGDANMILMIVISLIAVSLIAVSVKRLRIN
jgi:hypothetical protein